eukprot:359432-Chlamydomonas_euryale.AAC.2
MHSGSAPVLTPRTLSGLYPYSRQRQGLRAHRSPRVHDLCVAQPALAEEAGASGRGVKQAERVEAVVARHGAIQILECVSEGCNRELWSCGGVAWRRPGTGGTTAQRQRASDRAGQVWGGAVEVLEQRLRRRGGHPAERNGCLVRCGVVQLRCGVVPLRCWSEGCADAGAIRQSEMGVQLGVGWCR